MNTINLLFSLLILASTHLFAQSPHPIPTKPEMVFVQGGVSTMGSDNGDVDEKPVHDVVLSSFSIGKYEITVGQYYYFCAATNRMFPEQPYGGGHASNPVTMVSYNDALAYCQWLGELFGGYWRLPTEAEWERAARGGTKGKGYRYSGGDNLYQVGWFGANSQKRPHQVGLKGVNELGIYDMSGNVLEWCSDWYAEGYYAASTFKNPLGAATGSQRVLRGGCWRNKAEYCKVSSRHASTPESQLPYHGFRVVLSH